MTRCNFSSQAGVLLPTIIILTASAMVIAVGLLSFTSAISTQANATAFSRIAQSAAQSALNEGSDSAAQGAISSDIFIERELFTNPNYKVTYQLIATESAGSKTRYKAIGRVYVPASNPDPSYTREIKGEVF